MGLINQPRILISGAGSPIGYAAAKIISSYENIKLLSLCNVSSVYPAQTYSKTTIISPDFYFCKDKSEKDYIDFIIHIANSQNFDFIMPFSIFELQSLAANLKKIEHFKTRVVVESLDYINIFFDKLATYEMLESIGGNVPFTQIIISDGNSCILPNLPFPFLIKPQYGYGSKAISIINSISDFNEWNKSKSKKFSSFIAQQYLSDNKEEYSCTVTFKNDGKPKDVMAVRRDLIDGITMAATYDKKCHFVEDYIFNISHLLQGKYCLNFQIRLENSIPYIFEINPRFGAAESIRASFGFDSFYSVLSEYSDVQSSLIKRKYGKVIRAYEEIYLPFSNKEL